MSVSAKDLEYKKEFMARICMKESEEGWNRIVLD